MSGENTAQLVSFAEVIGFTRRRIALIAVGIVIGASLGFVGSGYIPKKYKSKAIFTIQSGYFHHPLISDVVAEIQDTGEMSSYRSALLRLALNEEFLERFGRTYFSAPHSHSGSTTAQDPESLLHRIEYFATNSTSFQVSVTTSSPTMAFSATNDVLAQILTTLAKKRREHLTRAHESLVRQATALQHAISQGTSTLEGDSIESRVGTMRSRLATLEKNLSDTHPDVISLRRQLDSLVSRAHEAPVTRETSGPSIPGVFLSPPARNPTQRIFDDLLKKISHLTIVLHTDPEPGHCSFVDIIEHPRIPSGPFSPKRAQFTLIGAAAGLFVALTIAIGLELRRNYSIKTSEVEAFLGTRLLGELPALHPSLSASPSLPPLSRVQTLVYSVMTGLAGV